MVACLAAADRVIAIPTVSGESVCRCSRVDRVVTMGFERDPKRQDPSVIFCADLVERLGAKIVRADLAGATAVPDAILAGVAVDNQWRIGSGSAEYCDRIRTATSMDDRQSAMMCSAASHICAGVERAVDG